MLEPVICVDVVWTSCRVSCWPGHWYLSQVLAHAVLVVCQRSIFLKSILVKGERDNDI